MKKLKEFTAVITIGNGTPEVGLFKTTMKVEASSQKTARAKALKSLISDPVVSVEVLPGKVQGINSVYQEIFGDNPEAW